VIKGNGADGVETTKVVLVRVIVAVPGDDIKGSVVLACGKEGVVELAVKPPVSRFFLILERGDGGLEVARIGKTV
jgi:hypothetical protein